MGAAALAGVAAGLALGKRSHDRYRSPETFHFHECPSVESDHFLRAFSAISGAPCLAGNEVELLVNGREIFPAMLDTIHGAERTLDVLSYIWWRGDVTTRIADAVCEQATAGVDCKVLLDAFGSRKIDRRSVRAMRECGVQVRFFRDLGFRQAFRRLNHRTHRRVIVADGRVGMTGGAGIAQEWVGDAEEPGRWRDNHCRVRGPVVAGLQAAFVESWLETTGEPLVDGGRFPTLAPLDHGSSMHLIASGPRLATTGAEAAYFMAILAAKESIDVTASYFAPPQAFVAGLADAARRGVAVRLLVPGPHPETALVQDAGRAKYAELLAAGAQIFEYEPTTLHAKGFIVDGTWSAIGTANFDERSFAINDEIALCVQDADFAGDLAGAFEIDLERSVPIQLSDWRQRPATGRIRELAASRIRHQL